MKKITRGRVIGSAVLTAITGVVLAAAVYEPSKKTQCVYINVEMGKNPKQDMVCELEEEDYTYAYIKKADKDCEGIKTQGSRLEFVYLDEGCDGSAEIQRVNMITPFGTRYERAVFPQNGESDLTLKEIKEKIMGRMSQEDLERLVE